MLKSISLSIFTTGAIAFLLFFCSCASSNKNFLSKTYHNTTAKYNAYFIANEDISEVEAAIADNHKNNYDKILGVFYDIDSSTINGVREQLDDAIVKASLAIQRHENSDWVYPSYYLVGKSRYYGGEFENAITTFKYIIKHGEDNDIRHKASVALMRSFIDYNEHNNAVSVADYLRKENLNKDNTRDFLLTKAYLFQLHEDYDNMVRNLTQAVEVESSKKKRARYYFILGQVYQQLGFDAEAYKHYKKCLRSNPEYELSFYAKLNLAQVTLLDQKADMKKIRKYFRKLLKDDKNRDFVDRIYYEMASFEIKHDNPDLAVDYLKSSIAESVNNPRQKGQAYLKLGELYYEHYKNYQLAQAYYDSTVTVLPPDTEGFEQIKERSDILTDFVTQLNTIQLQDSLLSLAAMNQDDLQKLLENVVAEEERQKKEKQKEARRIARQTASTGSGSTTNNPFSNNFGETATPVDDGGTWYFYNAVALASGRNQFLSRWGNRPLEDNWRRSKKAATGSFAAQETAAQLPEGQETAPQGAEEIQEEEEDRTSAMMSSIPLTAEAKAESLKKIEDAYFKLGGIYNFQLMEKQNAVETFEKLLSRFPGSEYEPEALYLLYLIFKSHDEVKASHYQQLLTERYPDSIYAKLAINPNYKEESNETAMRLQRLYKVAYDYYLADDFNQAKLIVSRGLQQYPDNEFSDQLKILGILIDGKIEGQFRYQFELQQFIDNNPDSKMLDYAKSLLEASKNFNQKELQRKGAKYITYFEQPHFFIFVYPNLGSNEELIPALIESFIDEKYNGKNLKTGNLTLNEGFSLVLVNKFETKDEAMSFYDDFNKSEITLPGDENMNFEKFVITEDNFQIFYQTRKTEDYHRFFQENYIP